MPHCVIEHSTGFDSDLLVQKVFAGALGSGLFAADGRDIKVRALAYRSYMTGPEKSGFIHVALRILSGRSAEQKSRLAQAVIDQLTGLGDNGASITVEVADMDRDSYRKLVKPA